ISIASISFTSYHAFACRVSTKIFFDEIPQTIKSRNAPDIVRVTVIETPTTEQGDYAVAIARVEKAIKGNIKAPTIKLLYVPTTCLGRASVGDSGIVLGTSRRDSTGAIEFFPIEVRHTDLPSN